MKKLLFLSLLALAACKKTDNSNFQLPGPSSTGQNYLACKVNGQLYHSRGLNSWTSRTGVSYSRFTNRVVVGGDDDGVNGDLGIYLYQEPSSLLANQDYILGTEGNGNEAKYFRFKQGGQTFEYTTSSVSGWVRFSRIDTTVAAGTFAFTAYRNGQKDADSVVITDGRFDISAE